MGAKGVRKWCTLGITQPRRLRITCGGKEALWGTAPDWRWVFQPKFFFINWLGDQTWALSHRGGFWSALMFQVNDIGSIAIIITANKLLFSKEEFNSVILCPFSVRLFFVSCIKYNQSISNNLQAFLLIIFFQAFNFYPSEGSFHNDMRRVSQFPPACTQSSVLYNDFM